MSRAVLHTSSLVVARRSARGATLIEAMSALVVFTVGILGVLQMNVLASAQTSLARDQTLASTIGRDLVDAFERLPYSHPAFSASTTAPTAANFIDPVANTNVLHSLDENFSPSRPISSSAYAAVMEVQRANAQPPIIVQWRVGSVYDPANPAVEEARRIAIMIRYPTRAGMRQTTIWTVKFNPDALVGAAAPNAPEI